MGVDMTLVESSPPQIAEQPCHNMERPQSCARFEAGRSTYWDYIQLDSLLSLPSPRTELPDERLFIIFHQIAEMSFAMILGELEQLTAEAPLPVSEWKIKLARVNAICGLFVHNTRTLGRCIDREQFLRFRETLSPASGFQSFQYRKMELISARLRDLILPSQFDLLPPDAPAELLFEHLYWRHAIPAERPAAERAMLLDFENRYLDDLRNIAIGYQRRNLAVRFAALPNGEHEDPALVRLLRKFDHIINRVRRGVHHQLALALLVDSSIPRDSTGGTDWCPYLAGSNTHIRFFPELFVSSVSGTNIKSS
jgi:tryptophan 2,3-dioxygenase